MSCTYREHPHPGPCHPYPEDSPRVTTGYLESMGDPDRDAGDPNAQDDPCEFDEGYEGVDESTPPPGYCQEAWDYVTSLYEDPMSAGAPCDEIVEGYMKKHYYKCKTCANRMDLARMP